MKTGLNYINGVWKASQSVKTLNHHNPADLDDITGQWPSSTAEDTKEAVQAAAAAFLKWSGMTVYQRAEYLKRAMQLIKDRASQIADVLTMENGKALKESFSEIDATVREMEFQINEGLRMAGEELPSMQSGVMAISKRRPLGVAAIISPWNFPFNVPCRKITPALISGNTCVMKPSNLTPGIGAEFVRCCADAGLPPGVLNFVSGLGAVVGEELVTNPKIKAISFTGSTEIGMGIQKKAAANLTRAQLEMGGKNPLVVLADADLEKAADAAVLAAFACAGQWCTSTSRVIVEKNIEKQFIDLLLARVRKIVVGRGTEPNVTMGPVCGEKQLKDILGWIATGKAEKARLAAGGRQLIDPGLARGCFIEPTVFVDVAPNMKIAQEEIFGPVLSVIPAKNFDDAIDIANGVRFGLASSVFTRDLQKAMTFIDRTDVGLTHVNMYTAYKEPQLSFGGVKFSGFGLPEAGHTGIEFFTEHKVAYIKYD